MEGFHKSYTVTDLGTDLEDVIPPQEFENRSQFVIVASNANGGGAGKALADFDVDFGPTLSGPWFTEDVSGTALVTLAVGAVEVFRVQRHDRYFRLRAKSAADGVNKCDLTVYLDVLP